MTRPEGDRADLLLRAAARLRGPADQRDDPHGGRVAAEALAVRPLHGAGAPRRPGASWTASRSRCVDRLGYALGNLLVYAPLRNTLGFSRVRVAYTAGEAIGPDLFVFYRSIGINLKQLYGSTETAVFVCLQPDHEVRADTVGVPIEGVEIKVDRRRRDPGALARPAEGVLQGPGRDRRGARRRRLVPHRRRRLHRRRRPPEDHRPRQGRRPDRRRRQRRRAVRAQVRREQAQVLPVHQGGGRLRRRARQGLRVRQHRHRGGRQLGREAQPAVRAATPTWRRSPRCSSWSASASRRSTPTSPPTSTSPAARSAASWCCTRSSTPTTAS